MDWKFRYEARNKIAASKIGRGERVKAGSCGKERDGRLECVIKRWVRKKMNEIMRRNRVLKYLLEKEFKQMLRNPIMLPLIIALPLIQLILLPYAATYEIRNIQMVVVDHDQSSVSRALQQKIASSGYFEIAYHTDTYQEALTHIEEGTASMILEIPENFEREMNAGEEVQLFVAADAVDGTKASIGTNYLNGIIQDFSIREREELAMKSPVAVVQRELPAQIEAIPVFRFNPGLDYKTYMVPGILALLLTLVGGILAALNISGERELGTLEQINVSPVRKVDYLLGKLIPFWIMGLVIICFGLGIAWLLYGIVPKGSFWTLIVFATIYNMGFIGFGLFISSVSKSQQQAMFIAFFFLLIFFLMGGLFTPVSSMPRWAQYITYLNPTAYLIDAMRLIILKGSGFADLWDQFWATLSFAVFFNGLALLTFRKTAK